MCYNIRMNNLILSSPREDISINKFDALTSIPVETVWLANFPSENTRKTYQRTVATFLIDLGIETSDQLYRVELAHVVAWRSQMRSEGKSNATVRHHLSALSSLYKFLTDRQLCPHNPVSGVLRPNSATKGVGSNKTPALTRRQVRWMLDAPLTHSGQRKSSELQKLRDRALLCIFFFTGARCSEPGSLKVRDFRQDRGYWVLEFTAKGEKTNVVAIAEVDDPDSECVTAIQEYLTLSGHGHDPEAPLFLAIKNGKSGQPLSGKTFYRIFKRYVDLIGLPDTITPHSARTSFITQCYEIGLPGEDIQQTVAHSSITTTEGYNQSGRKLRKSASLVVKY